MRLSTLSLLALPLLVVSVPAPWEVQVTVNGETSLIQSHKGVSPLSDEIPTFDDTRIQDHPDKLLLSRIRLFFKTFTTGDFDGMRDLQSEEYTMTDIRKLERMSPSIFQYANVACHSYRCHPCLPCTMVRNQ